jgi:hypothetical protein
MSITDLAPVAAGEHLFPTCAPWCSWHYAEDTATEPGCCWAEDVAAARQTVRDVFAGAAR